MSTVERRKHLSEIRTSLIIAANFLQGNHKVYSWALTRAQKLSAVDSIRLFWKFDSHKKFKVETFRFALIIHLIFWPLQSPTVIQKSFREDFLFRLKGRN